MKAIIIFIVSVVSAYGNYNVSSGKLGTDAFVCKTRAAVDFMVEAAMSKENKTILWLSESGYCDVVKKGTRIQYIQEDFYIIKFKYKNIWVYSRVEFLLMDSE